jgi:hypothetical protein
VRASLAGMARVHGIVVLIPVLAACASGAVRVQALGGRAPGEPASLAEPLDAEWSIDPIGLSCRIALLPIPNGPVRLQWL